MSKYDHEPYGFDGSSFEDQLAGLDSLSDQASGGREPHDESGGPQAPQEQAYPQGQWDTPPAYPSHNPPPPPYAQDPGPYPPPPAYPVPGYPQEPPAFTDAGYGPSGEEPPAEEPQSPYGAQEPPPGEGAAFGPFPQAQAPHAQQPPSFEQPYGPGVGGQPPGHGPAPFGQPHQQPYDQQAYDQQAYDQPPSSYGTVQDFGYDQRYDGPSAGQRPPHEGYVEPRYSGYDDPYAMPYDAYSAAMGPGMGPAAPLGPQQVPPPYQHGSQPPQQAHAQYAPQQVPHAPPPPETADSLNPETLLRGKRRPPSSGWRRAVYKASGGFVHPGESPAELRRRELVGRVQTPVAKGHHRVAVLSLKGGVGKTTSTIGLGSTLASLRGDRVIAVDANPDRGTLSDKVRLETAATVRDLLNERGQIQRYADVRGFTSQAPSRLEVLASDRDPAVSEAFSADDYRAVATVLEQFYSICITDCGTGLLHSAMSGVLGMADQIVLVSSPSVDGARSASATLDWLEAHEYGRLVRSAVVVLSTVRPKSKSTVDIERLHQHFANRCRDVVRIPYDPHLEEGAEVDLERLAGPTSDAYLSLAASVGDGFGLRE